MDKVERLTNVVALLLTTSRPLTLDEIADTVEGYPPPGEARRAAFERDKKTLRAEGVPLEVVPQPDGGSAYRIDPDAYYLPAARPRRRRACRAQPRGRRRRPRRTRRPRRALEAGRGSGRRARRWPPCRRPRGCPSCSTRWRRRAPATLRATAARHARSTCGASRSAAGRWYVVGFDHARGAERLFRVDRIAGDVTLGDDGSRRRAPRRGSILADALPGPAYELADDAGEVVEVDIDAGWVPAVRRELGADAIVERARPTAPCACASPSPAATASALAVRLPRPRGRGVPAGPHRRGRRRPGGDGAMAERRDPGMRLRRLLAMVSWLAPAGHGDARRAGRPLRR